MIGKLAMAPLTGQSWRVLKSWYTGGGLASHADVFRGARFSSPPRDDKRALPKKACVGA